MKTLVLLALCAVGAAASAQIRITEFMYSGGNAEFIEFTNVGNSAINMFGYSYDDDSRLAGTVDLSAFGIVATGESVILAEAAEADFRAAWGLAGSVKVIGSLATNLGRNDEINLYDSSLTLVDRLTFGDQNFPGTIRTQNVSGNTDPANYGDNTISTWFLSALGDPLGSWSSAAGDVGNPGRAALPVPEPAPLGALAVGGAMLLRKRR